MVISFHPKNPGLNEDVTFFVKLNQLYVSSIDKFLIVQCSCFSNVISISLGKH